MPGCAEWWVTSVDGKKIVATGALSHLRSDDIVLSRPGPAFWYAGGLLFSGGAHGLHINLWTLKLDSKMWKAVGVPRQLLNETARDLSPSLAQDGAIAYTRLTGALHIWRIDHAARPGSPILSKVTEDAEIDDSPFISEGGRYLVFERGRGTKRGIWIRDNLVPSETLLYSSGLMSHFPIIDSTGNLLVYEQMEEGGSTIYAKTRDAAAKQLCRGCSQPSGWFDSTRAFFYRDGTPSVIRMADPRTGKSQVVLQVPGAALGGASWSPVNQFLLFTETRGDRKHIFAVRLPRSSAIPEGKRIAIPDPGLAQDHPQWSGDGRTIFYISNSDGFPCIYGQAFSPETSEVVGAPFAVEHFHVQRANIGNVFAEALNLSVDGDSMYFNLGEQSSTIWTGSLVRP